MTSPNNTDTSAAIPHFQHPQPQGDQPAVGQIYNYNASVDQLNQQVQDLLSRVQLLENKRLVFNTGIIGLFETVSAVPTNVPISPYDQIKIYINATTYRLYWWNNTDHLWHYINAT